jgi:hypothetical protein
VTSVPRAQRVVNLITLECKQFSALSINIPGNQ